MDMECLSNENISYDKQVTCFTFKSSMDLCSEYDINTRNKVEDALISPPNRRL